MVDWKKKDSNAPFIISGPCSAENPEQLLETATRLKSLGRVDLLRAGIWKPRTRPDSFEGVGEEGLAWLAEVGRDLQLPVTTEVASAEHVELALKHEVDVLWIGARTTVNPFSVQSIADALKGVDIPVMIKNPINPDMNLWVGAVERIRQAGIEDIVTIHRGFSFYGDSPYRNKPMWEIPIAMKTWFPDIPMFCDPSHICGRRDLLRTISQRALDLGFEGLMIESHRAPDEAWSDAAQQVTPENLGELLQSLQYKSEGSLDPLLTDNLAKLRNQIDEIDDEILRLIARRMEVAESIGEHKKEHDLMILQLQRWREIVDSRTALAKTLGLSKDFIAKYLEQIHKESIRKQAKVMNKDEHGEDRTSILW